MTSPRFSITLPDDLYDRVVEDAARRHQSLGALVRDALSRYYSEQLPEELYEFLQQEGSLEALRSLLQERKPNGQER